MSGTAGSNHRRFHRFRILVASSSSSIPSRALRRKSYLQHPKIVKTLTKALPTAPLPEIVPPAEEVESYVASEAVNNAGNFGGVIGKLSVNSVLKFAVLLLGFFVLEAAVAVLLFGPPEKEERLRNLDKRRNFKVSVWECGLLW
ncbi:unnamed protein product [Linum tenue]|uniref:Uncharacterized protein n=1 Tax=Linum tenue TaxID=586396 RepID=A0AAV0S181_9ROSI|nr:unnamed protein product [Linum tenue]